MSYRGILAPFCFIALLTFSCHTASGKYDLKVKGAVLGYNLAYEWEPKVIFSFPPSFIGIPTSILVVQVKKGVKNNKLRSDYIIVKFYGYKKNYTPPNLVENKDLNFKLDRQIDCDETLRRLSIFDLTDETGQVRHMPNITWVEDAKRDLLPMDKELPCYFVSQK